MCICLADVSTVQHAWIEHVTGTCESYRERRKTWEPFIARTVVITEKFVGKDEPRGTTKEQRQQRKAQSHTDGHLRTPALCNLVHLCSVLLGNSCLVGALSWIFLSILNDKSVSSCPSRLTHSPASRDTPSMSSDRSSIFRTSTRSAAKETRGGVWVKEQVGVTEGGNKTCTAVSDPDVPAQSSNQPNTGWMDGWSWVWFVFTALEDVLLRVTVSDIHKLASPHLPWWDDIVIDPCKLSLPYISTLKFWRNSVSCIGKLKGTDGLELDFVFFVFLSILLTLLPPITHFFRFFFSFSCQASIRPVQNPGNSTTMPFVLPVFLHSKASKMAL